MRLLNEPNETEIAVTTVCCSRLDLSKQICLGLDLSDSNLSNSNLQSANLAQTCLWGTNLYGANLSGATLFCATLTHANLGGANLTGVRGLDGAFELQEVGSWQGTKIERRWVERLGLDVENAGLDVIENIKDDGQPTLVGNVAGRG
jgi:Pentapeptide repeats (8 copies)